MHGGGGGGGRQGSFEGEDILWISTSLPFGGGGCVTGPHTGAGSLPGARQPDCPVSRPTGLRAAPWGPTGALVSRGRCVLGRGGPPVPVPTGPCSPSPPLCMWGGGGGCIREVLEWPYTAGGRGLPTHPPQSDTEALCQTPPPLQTKVTVGKNEILQWEGVGPFLVHKILGPRPPLPPPPPQGCIRRGGASEAVPEAVRQAVGGGCQPACPCPRSVLEWGEGRGCIGRGGRDPPPPGRPV